MLKIALFSLICKQLIGCFPPHPYCSSAPGSLPAHYHAWKHNRQEAGSLQAHRWWGQACLGSRPARFWPEEEGGGQTRVSWKVSVYFCMTDLSTEKHPFDSYGFGINLTSPSSFFRGMSDFMFYQTEFFRGIYITQAVMNSILLKTSSLMDVFVYFWTYN